MSLSRRTFLKGVAATAIAAWAGVPVTPAIERKAEWLLDGRWAWVIPQLEELQRRFGSGNVMVSEFDYGHQLGVGISVFPEGTQIRHGLRIFDQCNVVAPLVEWCERGGPERALKRYRKHERNKAAKVVKWERRAGRELTQMEKYRLGVA